MYSVKVFVKRVYNVWIFYLPLLSISSKCMITLTISDAKRSRMNNILCPGIFEKSLQCKDPLSTLAEYIKQINDNVNN